MSEDLKFPIGKFDKNFEFSADLKGQFISEIAALPEKLNDAVKNLSEEQIDTPYRPGGWTVRQTIHHIADSHLNSFCRFKLALTEDSPTIRPYFEDLWAETADAKNFPLEHSIKIIEGVHARWTALLNSMSDADFQRKLVHPETGEWTLDKMLGLYSWHGRHHKAHITNLRKRNNW